MVQAWRALRRSTRSPSASETASISRAESPAGRVRRRLRLQFADPFEPRLQRLGEAGRGEPVDDAVVVGDAQGRPPRGDDATVLHDGALLDRADEDEDGLIEIEDRRTEGDAVAAEVGNREAGAADIARPQPAGASRGDQLPRPVGDPGQSEAVGAAHHRDRQAYIRSHRKTDADVGARDQPIVGEVDVQRRGLRQAVGRRLDEQVVERGAGGALPMRGSGFGEGSGVDLDHLNDVRRLSPGAGETLRRGFLQARQPDFPGGRGLAGGRDPFGRSGGLHVRGDDQPVGAVRRDLADVEVQGAGERLGLGRRQGPFPPGAAGDPVRSVGQRGLSPFRGRLSAGRRPGRPRRASLGRIRDHGERVADRDLVSDSREVVEHARGRRLDLEGGLVGLHRGYGIAGPDHRAVGGQPFGDGAEFHRLAELGHDDRARAHAAISRAVATISSVDGMIRFTRAGTEAIGTSGIARRRKGRSRYGRASSKRRAPISAPTPRRR